MGPRREPLTIITTTASLISAGPFMEMLDSMHRLLQQELKYDTGEATPTLAEDRQMMLLLEPDMWEREEEYMLTSKTLRRKINPMLGKIVQHSFYEQEVASARMDETKKKETISKLFNVYQTGRVTTWIKGDRIRPLQVAKRITDCKYADGWRVFGGLDFSHGDDLFAEVFMGVNYTPSDTMLGRFFADAYAWVLEETMKQSPNRPLYEQWVEQGWLHVCPGEVFDSMYAINRLADITYERRAYGTFDFERPICDVVSFGYDPAQSIQPINQLKAWLQTLFQARFKAQGLDVSPKELAEVINRMVIPVSQTSMSMNPRIAELETMILDKEPWIQFSMSPLWPWCFGNAAVEVSTNDLRRICKGGPQPTHKIDLVHGLLDALYCFDASEGRIER